MMKVGQNQTFLTTYRDDYEVADPKKTWIPPYVPPQQVSPVVLPPQDAVFHRKPTEQPHVLLPENELNFEYGVVVLLRGWCGTLKRVMWYFEDGGVVYVLKMVVCDFEEGGMVL